jgi:polar amino acid transport system substrate-binding protein
MLSVRKDKIHKERTMVEPLKQFFRSFLIVSMLVLVASSCFANTKTLQVVYTEWFPYTYQKQGKASGFEIATFKAIMEKMQIPVEFRIYPWKRCLDQLKKGRADVLISMLFTDDREQYTYYPKEHISISRTMLATTIDHQISFNGSFEELHNYVIGYIMGFTYGEAFDKATYLKKDEAKNAKVLIKKLLKGRNDLIAENQTVLKALAQKFGIKDQIKFLNPPIHTQKLFVGFSKVNKLAELSDRFSKALSSFKKTKSYHNILAQYNIVPSDMK